MKTLLEIIQKISSVEAISLVDVGSRWGVQRPWDGFPKKSLKYFGFDADKDECARLNATNEDGHESHLPYVVSDQPGHETLYLMATEGLSSIYRPNLKRVERYCEGTLDWTIKNELKLATDTLENVFRQHGIRPSFLKIDTQGAELKILHGLGENWNELLGLELEVEFVELYENQPLFAEIDTLVRRKGFELFDLNRYWANRRILGKNNSRRGQVVFGDAVYFRSLESFYALEFDSLEERKHTLLQLVQILCLYGFFDVAAEYVSHAKSPLLPEDIITLMNALTRISAYPTWQRWLFNNRVANWLGGILLRLGNSLRYRHKSFGWGTDYNEMDGRYCYHRKGPLSSVWRK